LTSVNIFAIDFVPDVGWTGSIAPRETRIDRRSWSSIASRSIVRRGDLDTAPAIG